VTVSAGQAQECLKLPACPAEQLMGSGGEKGRGMRLLRLPADVIKCLDECRSLILSTAVVHAQYLSILGYDRTILHHLQ
jgi:hypothetical protein